MKIQVNAKYVNGEIELLYSYYGNGTTAIQGFFLDDGEPAFKATVAVVDERPADGCVFLKGWSENEGIPEALEKAGIVEFTGRTVSTGYCEAIEAKLLIKE